MGEAFIFIMGLICTGSVVIAAILSINELKDIEEPKLQDYNMSNAAKKSLRFIFQGVFLIILLVSLGLICFYIIFAWLWKLIILFGGLRIVNHSWMDHTLYIGLSHDKLFFCYENKN